MRDPDQHHAVVARAGRRFKIRLRHLLLLLPLLELHDRNLVLLSELINRLHVRGANLTERSGRGNLELALPSQERTDPSHRLQLGDVRLQKDPIDGTVLERHVISQ